VINKKAFVFDNVGILQTTCISTTVYNLQHWLEALTSDSDVVGAHSYLTLIME
jgi:hypothetical protein